MRTAGEVDELVLAERVAEGAAFMDAIDANVTDDAEVWFWVVNPETLDMGQSTGGHQRECGCILGQHSLSGFYDPKEYGLLDMHGRSLGLEATSQGFEGRQWEYATLSALWIEEINDRRAAWFDAHPEAVIG